MWLQRWSVCTCSLRLSVRESQKCLHDLCILSYEFWSLIKPALFNTKISTRTPPTCKYEFLEKFSTYILTRNFEQIFIYMYFIYSVHYFVVWKHIFLILERRLTIFVWLSTLWIHIKTWPFVVMWDRLKRKVDVFAIRMHYKRYTTQNHFNN